MCCLQTLQDQHERRHLHQCTFATCSIDGHPYGNDKQYIVWWQCRRTMACGSPWVVPEVMGPFAASKPSKNIYQPAQAKRIGLAWNRPHMQGKSSNVMSVQRNIPHRLHYSSTRRCTKALTRSMCAACVAKLSAQQQPSTNMKRYIKVTKVFKPNSKF